MQYLYLPYVEFIPENPDFNIHGLTAVLCRGKSKHNRAGQHFYKSYYRQSLI
jgi:hypothetical protein